MTATHERAPPSGRMFDSFASFPIDNPYPGFDRLRAADRVFWDPGWKIWAVTGYEEVRVVLTDPAFDVADMSARVTQFGDKIGKQFDALERSLQAVLFFKTGDAHRYGRRTLSRLFGRIPLSQMEPVIESLADELVGRISGRDSFDAMTEFANPLPTLVMAHLMGLLPEDMRLIADAMDEFTRTFDIVPASLYQRVDDSCAKVQEVLSRRIRDSGESGRKSGLTLLYEDMPDHGDEALKSMAALAIFGFLVGAETTISLIGSCMRALLHDADLYRRARADVSLAAAIATEVTRLECPVQRTMRIALKDCVVGGKEIRQGERVILLLGGANRDPAAFPHASELDTERESDEGVAFGAGSHLCIGMSLARLEARIAVAAFLRLPPLVLAEPGETWHLGRTIRKLTSLPVRIATPL